MSMFGDLEGVEVVEETVLEKFDNETGHLVEKLYIVDGNIVNHEFYENGELVHEEAKEVE